MRNTAYRFVLPALATTLAGATLAVGCGSKGNSSKGAEPTPAPVSTIPQVPNPTPVGTGGYPTNPNYPGYPNNGGYTPPNNNSGWTPPANNNPRNCNISQTEIRAQGTWVTAYQGQPGYEAAVSRLTLSPSNGCSFSLEGQAAQYIFQQNYGAYSVTGTYAVNPSMTQTNTIGIEFRSSTGYQTQARCLLVLGQQSGGYNPGFPSGPGQESLQLWCYLNGQETYGQQPTFIAEFTRQYNTNPYPY